eukprot:gene9648-7563_t
MSEIDALVQSAVSTLAAAAEVHDTARGLAAIQDGELNFDVQLLHAAADRVKNDAAKVGMMWATDGQAPSTKEAASLIDVIVQSSIMIITGLHYASLADAGPTLKKSLKKVAKSVADNG